MRKSICFITAVPGTARAFLKGHIAALSKEYDVYLVADIQSEEEVAGLALTGWHRIDIERKISIWRDIKAVWAAFRYFRKMRFDAVHSVTPKAGLVTALAAKLAGIRHRTHIFTGQVWATRKGVMRFVLKSIDKVIVLCDNHIMLDGLSQRAFMENKGVIPRGQARVFGSGSISGVDAERFVPDANARQEVRHHLRIKDSTVCFVFLGRLNRDKGIYELYEAFNRLAAERDVFLLMVGEEEEEDVSNLSAYSNIIDGKNFHYYGHTCEPEKVLCAGDVFVLPTWREGFGTSVIEAACVGLPSICSDAYGVLDSYVEGETGLRCHVSDSESLYQCMKEMYDNPEMRAEMGQKSRERALRDFNGADLTKYWVEFYKDIL